MNARLLSILLLFPTMLSFGQKEAAYWVFGQNAMLDFTSGNPVFVGGSAMVQQEGCASIADTAGNLLFYTNGIEVWDASHTLMPNGTGLLGDNSSTQSSIIVPRPEVCDNYYIFTTDGFAGPDGLRYCEVDMTLNSNMGDVLNGNKNTLLVTNVDEKVAATMHANGTDYWVLTHLNDTNIYHAYHVTPAGVNTTPVVSIVGTTANPPNAFGGQLKFSADGSRVGFCHNQAVLEVYDFDNATGQLSNAIELQTVLHTYNSSLNMYTGAAYYGLEFSPNGQVLYASRWSGSPRLAQFDLSSGNVNTIAASEYAVATNSDIYGLQLATDGKVYVARVNQPLIAAINSPNTLGVGCGFTPNAVNITGGAQCRVTPPSLVSNFVITGFQGVTCAGPPLADFQAQDTLICEGDCIDFTDASSLSPDNWQWAFPGANPTFSNDTNPSNICYNQAGTYTVTLIVSNINGSDTIEKTITVLPEPTVSLGSDTTICSGTVTLDAGTSGNIYTWSTGETTQTIQVSNTGTYWVEVSNGACSAFDTLEVLQGPPPTATISNGKVCPGDSATITASGGINYIWNTGETSQQIKVAANAGDQYSVTVSDNCGSDVDTVTISLHSLPNADAGEDTTIIKGTSTQLHGEQGAQYFWTPEEGLSCTDCQNPIASPNSTTKYYLTVIGSNGCLNYDTVTVFVDGEASFFLPNIFSPNGDGVNDVLYLRGKGITDFTLVIFDRWGAKVFETSKLTWGWDGTVNGKMANPGVFAYTLNVNFITGQEHSQKGNITLIR